MEEPKLRMVALSDIALASTVRARMQMSQREFAQFLGVERRSIREWETGQRPLTKMERKLLIVAFKFPEILNQLD